MDKGYLGFSIILFVIGCLIPFILPLIQNSNSTTFIRPDPIVLTFAFPLIFFCASGYFFLMAFISKEEKKVIV